LVEGFRKQGDLVELTLAREQQQVVAPRTAYSDSRE
jgi:hypothetical protein